jgi:drug/metabolite transporter (DMT)-like permease
MEFDSTTLGILLGIIGTISFILAEIYYKKDLQVINSVVIFLALYAIVIGGDLIYAALHGDSSDLPTAWREYLGVAGVVCIGLSVQHIIASLKKLPIRSGEAKSVEDRGGS